ncbi:MAG: acyl-ACP--UDP-N-acetylglucosamine O-acyltransferase [Acetobacteraceae bacterium]|nr:acyl-ACP--UDP-N-acetylglucosamine O-acyltransferase [Acetobacteraceae bacterium]
MLDFPLRDQADAARARPVSVHPTAIVEPGAQLGHAVEIGPWCHVGPDVRLGDGARLVSHVVVGGGTSVGAGAVLYPFCTVGLAPQDLKYRGEPTRCEIGARTQVREHCTIHRGTVTGTGVTRVGADCLLMAVVHVAHDCEIGDGVVIANNVVMGGHVTIGANAVIGGAAAIHQFVRIGRGAMVGGVSGVEADVIPFGSVIGNRARLAGLNVIGLRRRGVDRAQLMTLRAAVQRLFWGSGVFADRLAAVRETYGDDPLTAEVIEFASVASKRGLIRTGTLAED